MVLELLAAGSEVVLWLPLGYDEDAGLVLLVPLPYGTDELGSGRLLLVPPVERVTEWLETE